MKKILLLLVSCLLIACMAGSAMAAASCTLVNSTTHTPISGDLSLANGESLSTKLQVTGIGNGDLNIPWTIKYDVNPLPSSNGPVGSKNDVGVIIVGTNQFTLTSTNNYLSNAVITIIMDGAPVGASYKVSVGAYYDNPNDGTSSSITAGDITLAATSQNITAVPEFPTVALPIAALIGLVFIFGRKKEEI